MRNITVNLNRT